MKTTLFSYKSVDQVINHCRALAQFACNIRPSKLPLLDFDYYAPELSDYLSLCKTQTPSKSFYLIYRTRGFDYFRHFATAVLYKEDYPETFLASYTITYSETDDLFIIKSIEL